VVLTVNKIKKLQAELLKIAAERDAAGDTLLARAARDVAANEDSLIRLAAILLADVPKPKTHH
jgi:hypothetical protein